jgi:hypothetical protein
LVEAFDLAVGLGPVGPCAFVADLAAVEEVAEAVAVGVGPGVVGEESLRGDAVVAVEREGAFEEADDGVGLVVVVDLCVAEAGVVVEDRVDVVVADLGFLVGSWWRPGSLKRAYLLTSMCSRSPGQGHSYLFAGPRSFAGGREIP